VIEVKDTVNGNITAETWITISDRYIQVVPDEIWRLHLIPLPVLIAIFGSNTNFEMFNTKISFSPSEDILEIAHLVFPPETILAVLLIRRGGLGTSGNSTVSITVETPIALEEVSNKITLKMLPWILEEEMGN